MTEQTLVTLERINSLADSIIERVIEEKAKRLLATISYNDFQREWGASQVTSLCEKYFDLMIDLANTIEYTFMTNAELTVQEYLLAILENENKVKPSFAYDNEEQAEKDGFYWMDEIEKWVQLLS